jgi:hypothetical protein
MNEIQMQAKEILYKYAKALAMELVEVVAIPALEQAVKNTATPIDDIAVASLKQPLKDSLKELLEKIG